jgi:opacity protein-like surface antigen
MTEAMPENYMKHTYLSKYLRISLLLVMLMLIAGKTGIAQEKNIRFGVFADPVIAWFSSDTKETMNDGARPGINFGFTFNKYFDKNYSFSTGLSLLNAGGRLTGTDTVKMVFNNFTTEVAPGEPMIYRIQYLNIPLGLKFESDQIGYTRFFVDLGLDAKVVLSGKVDVPSEDIEKEAAADELNLFNFGYHLMAGIEYSLGGNTEVVLGLGYENNFLDVTNDINDQATDRIKHNILRFRIGLNF